MRQFIYKSLGIVMLLACVLLVESWVMGSLPLLIALLSVPTSGWLALSLFKAGLSRRNRSRRRVAARRRVLAQHPLREGSRRPMLRIAPDPNGPKVA